MARKREQNMQERFLGGPGGVHPAQRRRIGIPRWILVGLVRLFVWVFAAAAVSVGIALLIGHFRGSDPARSVPVGLYIGGAALVIVSLVGTGAGRGIYGTGYPDPVSGDLNMRRVQALRGAYVLVGLLVIGLGLLCDWLL